MVIKIYTIIDFKIQFKEMAQAKSTSPNSVSTFDMKSTISSNLQEMCPDSRASSLYHRSASTLTSPMQRARAEVEREEAAGEVKRVR